MRIRVGWLRLHTRSRLGPVPGSHHGTKKPLASPVIHIHDLAFLQILTPLKNPPNVPRKKGPFQKEASFGFQGIMLIFFGSTLVDSQVKITKKHQTKQLSTMKGWRVFESMNWNYHLHWTTSKIRKVGMEKSLIYVWPPLSSFFLGFDSVYNLYLYTSRFCAIFWGPVLKSNSQISEEWTNLWYYSDCFFWFWASGQKRAFVTTLIGGISSLKKPQPDASLSTKELDGSARSSNWFREF